MSKLLLSFWYPCSVSLPRGVVGLSVVFLSDLLVVVFSESMLTSLYPLCVELYSYIYIYLSGNKNGIKL